MSISNSMSRSETTCLIDSSKFSLQQQMAEFEAKQKTLSDILGSQVNGLHETIKDHRKEYAEGLEEHTKRLQSVHEELVHHIQESEETQTVTDDKLDLLREGLENVMIRSDEIVDHINDLYDTLEHQAHEHLQQKTSGFLTHVCAAVGISTWSAVAIVTWILYFTKGPAMVSLNQHFPSVAPSPMPF